jgi:hypothetical protein
MADGDKVGFRHIVPSLFNGVATALTAAAGLIGVLYQTGYLGNRAPQPAAEVAARARAHMRMHDDTELAAVASPAVPGPLINGRDDHRTAPAAVPRQRNLSGAWRDAGSNCHQIVQVGHALTVTSYFVDHGRRAVGSGTVKGRAISMRMNSANPASAEADLVVSDDGRELSGMINGVKGAHVAKWRFVGPSCVQTARPE